MDDGFTIIYTINLKEVNGIYDGSNYYLTCIGKRFSVYDFYPAVVTEWVRLTSVELCIANRPALFGLIEVKAFGRFMGN